MQYCATLLPTGSKFVITGLLDTCLMVAVVAYSKLATREVYSLESISMVNQLPSSKWELELSFTIVPSKELYLELAKFCRTGCLGRINIPTERDELLFAKYQMKHKATSTKGLGGRSVLFPSGKVLGEGSARNFLWHHRFVAPRNADYWMINILVDPRKVLTRSELLSQEILDTN